MEIGQTIGGRFLVEELAGRGGMGAVYRAIDTTDGSTVAIKVLELAPMQALARFEREARVLSSLVHDDIVRFIGRGQDEGRPWLAMEWLEGRDLAALIQEGPLGLGRSLAIAVRVASALGAAHEAGVVHRDVKPSNVFMGADDRVKVIDFGIAQVAETVQHLTGTGQFLGTAGYMAPEQIMGSREVDARADVFALGCVLFECLTGKPAFPGNSAIAVIAKIIADDPVPPSREAENIPDALDALVLRMLAKKADERVADMATVELELRALLRDHASVAVAKRDHITRREQMLVGVVLASLEDAVPSQNGPSENGLPETALSQIANELGARRHKLGNGLSLFVLGGRLAADEQAARAAECALRILAVAPAARVAVATGLADSEMLVVGPAIDRCVELIGRAEPGIALEESTARLLGDRFDTASRGDILSLKGRRDGPPRSKNLGPKRALVGREKELAYLVAELEEALEEPRPCAVLLLGDAGAGKSSLLAELLRRAVPDGARVLHARASSLGAGAALSVARQLVSGASGLSEGDTSPNAWSALSDYLGTLGALADRSRSADFLGELLRIRPREEPGAALAAARGEPRVSADWMRRSYVEWLVAEATLRPLVLVLEDLHWGDPATIAWVSEAMKTARALPFVVLSTARLEVHDRLPELRALLEPNEVRLAPLSRKAAQSIVRAHLGADASAADVDRIVDAAGGNPFFVEELSRSRPSVQHDAATLLAVLQARIGRLDASRRRLLRAASVFGRNFGSAGVSALLGDVPKQEIEADLTLLVRDDLVEPGLASLSADSAWSFRHDLLRDAAYATLPDVERKTAHRLAGNFLESGGGADPLVLADHFERAGDGSRAARHLLDAALAAERAGSLADAFALLERPVMDEAESLKGIAYALRASIQVMQRNWDSAVESSRKALALVPPGTVEWFRAAAIEVFAGLAKGDHAAIERAAVAVGAMTTTPEPTGPYGFTVMSLTVSLALAGQRRAAESFFGRIEPILGQATVDPMFAAWGHMAQSQASVFLRDAPGIAARAAIRSQELAESIGDQLLSMNAHYYLGNSLVECGDGEGADAALQPVVGGMATPLLEGWALQALARAKLRRGDLAAVPGLLARVAQFSDPVLQQRGKTLEARLLFEQGRIAECEALARELVAARAVPFDTVHALTILARVTLSRGAVDEAHSLVHRAIDLADKLGVMPTVLSWLLSIQVEVARAEGRVGDAERLLASAADRVLGIASLMPSERLAQIWVSLPEHAALALRMGDTPLVGAMVGEAKTRNASTPPASFDDDDTVDVTGFGAPEG